MKRRGLIRFQIVVLVLLAGVVIVRMITGPPPPDGLVVFTDLDHHGLYHEAFELGTPAEVVIQATGSFDEAAMSMGLAAYAWVVRRDSREVVWQMKASRVQPGPRNRLAVVRGDTLRLEEGVYDAYFSSFGQVRRSSHRAEWRRDADDWLFVLRLLDENAPARLLADRRLEDLAPMHPGRVVKRMAPLRGDQEVQYLFEVEQPTELEIYAVGEIDDEPEDYAWIENVMTGARVWGFSRDNTVPAGGLPSNRLFRGTLPLSPGVYRAVAHTNRRHGFRHWAGNPPLDPTAWGLTLYADDPAAVATFDPWKSRQPIVSFTRVPDAAERSQRFRVETPTDVIVYALGEITRPGGDDIYDYGELLKEGPQRKQRIWKMSWDGSQPAGGHRKNRREVVFLRLEPGTYTFRYVTDDSHAYDDWNESPPDHEERWGATLFPVAPALDPTALVLLSGEDAEPEPMRVAHAGQPIVAWTRLRGNVDESHAFILEDPATLHIVALGEITSRAPVDWGWIERADDGEVVWEMTKENTRPAGGTDRNSRFDDVIELPSGHYVVHFKTDDTHHYRAFGEDAPDHPEDWGITIHYVDEEADDAGNE